ncbi:MAG: nicotinate phosphoribosyltransferase [Methanotrichaceae archaeon]
MSLNDRNEKYPLLATDLYELTMAKGYLDSGMENKSATFDLFVRDLPLHWGFLLANGIEDAIDFLTEAFSIHAEELDYLRDQRFPEYFLEFLADLKFTGDAWAVPEGTPVAANAPIIRVTAPLVQAQLVETALLNMVNFQMLIATKASRIVRAAAGAKVVDFGLRRAQGYDAGLKGARAAFIGGCSGTSNVDAGRIYDIPISGTQAHSWVMAFPTELEAFRAYANSFQDNVSLLIDTYDVLQGAENASIVAKELKSRGHRLNAVRIDSGDLGRQAGEVRAILDREGLADVTIIGTSDLNEFKINELVANKAKIDAYGVGTELITGKPVAALSSVYKLAQIEDRPVIKLSRDKVTYPGIKQVYRLIDAEGIYEKDILALDGEEVQECFEDSSHDLTAIPLLRRAIAHGRRTSPGEDIHKIQQYVAECISKMPQSALRIIEPKPYTSVPSQGLIALIESLRSEYGTK